MVAREHHFYVVSKLQDSTVATVLVFRRGHSLAVLAVITSKKIGGAGYEGASMATWLSRDLEQSICFKTLPFVFDYLSCFCV